ncbi:Rp1-like protein [Rhynchospora pubera]|uniref:Rp1-like protein n=1 Tax=Rhynchospora pubera TaxID=906938 RepID=A0AAV8GGA3_9POAL|nr:Rp1-like protein [Rhynchospora pubera]KAJ4804724.1 Rp1-like protein [Rhynchospora pubera]
MLRISSTRYEHLKHKAIGGDKKLGPGISTRSIIKPFSKFTSKLDKKVSLLSPQKRELLSRLNKLKEIAAEAKTFSDLLKIQTSNENNTNSSNGPSITSSLLKNKVFGRDGERDYIINYLLDDKKENSLTRGYLVYAITAMGGAGKTTLAQYVYNDERVKNHFGLRMWISLSHNLDIMEHTKEMIECVSRKECPNLRNLSVLQNKLTDALPESEEVLLVLDDVWYDTKVGEEQWDNLLAPFATIQGRCKILFTSRLENFPGALLPVIHIQLRDLAPDNFLSLFRYYAFLGLENIVTQLKNHLSGIGDRIAKKLTKSPLAAKVVGNQLRKQPHIRFWKATLENVNLKNLMDVLLWSYQHLDVQLQQCFWFCSLFPKGAEHTANHLAKYWIALDFIQTTDDNRNVEDIGFEYFHMMVAHSIFQPVNQSYIMHDLFHDLAENLSSEDCFRLINAERDVPTTIRHVFLTVNNENLKENLSRICNLSDLRTLILNIKYSMDDASEIFSIISTNFKYLRVLKLHLRGYKVLPRTIGDMRNLRYLNIRRSSIKELPDSVTQLYHMQFLFLPASVKTLPTKLSNLIKLRDIKIYDSNHVALNSLPPVPYLGRLTSLQRLYEFHVRNEEGYELRQLGNLGELSGTLKIVNLENVIHKDEAAQARLNGKTRLKKLKLVWSKPAENGSELEVIEALQPPPNLEALTIKGYMGSTYPTWLLKGSFIENINSLVLNNCNALTTLPRNFNQSHYCLDLGLENLGSLRELPTLPESLTTIRIIRCPCLIFKCENEVQLNGNQGMVDERSWISSIMQINEISAKSTNYMKDALAYEFKSFEKTISVENCFSEQLKIAENNMGGKALELSENVLRAWCQCHQQKMHYMFSHSTGRSTFKLPSMLQILTLGYCCISDGALSECLRGMTTLEELYLMGIMTITTLPPAQVLESLQHLRVLETQDCWCLRSLGGLRSLPNLLKFQVQGSWCLEMESDYTQLPPTLQFFTVENCILPPAILNGDLPCLQHVEIENCLVSASLSLGQLFSLKSLKLVNCPDLCHIQGLKSHPSMDYLHLVRLPQLVVESVMESWQGSRELYISSSIMLNELLSSEKFVPPQTLGMAFCQEEAITFENSYHFRSIKKLVLLKCKTKNLPTLSDFSNLEIIEIWDCTEISELPELPDSVQEILIRGCPGLRERCQPNGPDWHKIRCIQSWKIR